MQVIIREQVQNIPVTTVTLHRDIADPEGMRLKMFHCSVCGFEMIQYKGNIIYIMPGGITSSTGVVIRCRGCKTNYLFDAIL